MLITDTKSVMPGTRNKEQGKTVKGQHYGVFQGDGTVPDLDSTGGAMKLHVC